eukprot:6061636-Pyramimonas_sp.AAC.1
MHRSAMHRRRRPEEFGESRAPHRATSAMHQQCGATLRHHLLEPPLGGLEPGRSRRRRRRTTSPSPAGKWRTRLPAGPLRAPP